MGHRTNITQFLKLFVVAMRHLSYFLVLILTFEVFCHFTLFLQTIHTGVAVLSEEMVDCVPLYWHNTSRTSSTPLSAAS